MQEVDRLTTNPHEEGEGATCATRVVNVRAEVPEIYIGRPGRGYTSIWGNPFAIGLGRTRLQAIAEFEHYLLWSDAPGAALMRAELHQLQAKSLGCFCAPQACHGHVLAWHADSLAPGEALPKGGKGQPYCRNERRATPLQARLL